MENMHNSAYKAVIMVLFCLLFSSCRASLADKANNHEWKEVLGAIENGSEGTSTTHFGTPIIYYAARDGRLDVVRFLLGKGVPIDQQNRLGDTALHAATEECHSEIARFLVANGADFHRPQNLHGTVLHLAANTCPDLVSFFVGLGIDVNVRNEKSNALTPLFSGVHNLTAVKELLRLGADVNIRNRDGQNAFDFALSLNNSEVLILLLDHGVSVSHQDISSLLSFWAVGDVRNLRALFRRDLITPSQALHALARAKTVSTEDHPAQSREEILAALLANGIDIRLRDQDGSTVLMTALKMTETDEVFLRFLLGKGASIVGENRQGQSALSISIGHWEEHLVSTGAEWAKKRLDFVMAEYEKRFSSLSTGERVFFALVKDDTTLLKTVIKGGYRFMETDIAQVAFVYAAANHDSEVLRLLHEAGASIDPYPEVDDNSIPMCCFRPTALIAASRYGKTENVRWLLMNGASPAAHFGCCAGGISASDVARNDEIRELLRQAEAK